MRRGNKRHYFIICGGNYVHSGMGPCFLLPGLRLRTTWPSAEYATALPKVGRPSFSTSDPRIQRIESHRYNCSVEAEPLHRCCPVGYHPVHLGDSFRNDRYTVIHKLGSGGYSTVWLARDKTQQRYVALKIAVSALSSTSRDLQTLQLLGQRATTSHHSQYIQRLLDAFEHVGPNGTHLCLVLELLGPSVPALIQAHYPDGRLPGIVARRVVLQVASGLAFLHENGIGHGGTKGPLGSFMKRINQDFIFLVRYDKTADSTRTDLHTGNIAFVPLPSIDALSEAELMAKLGSPDTGAVNHIEGGPLPPQVPKYLVWPTTLPMPKPTAQDSVKIIDFGESLQPDNCLETLHYPLGCQSPRGHIRRPYRLQGRSLESRLHSRLRLHGTIFSYPWLMKSLSSSTQMIESIGELPKKWQRKQQRFSAYGSTDTQMALSDSSEDTPLATTHCSSDETTDDVKYSLQQWLEEVYYDESKTADLTRRDMAKVGDLLRLLLRFDVEARLGATDLIHGTWLE